MNTASIWWITMKLNIFSTYCCLSVMLSHGFHLVDESGCTFAQSVSLYERFPSFGWKPMKSKLLLNGTVGDSHGWDVSRWKLFRPSSHSVTTYRLVKCQYLFFGISNFTMCLFWNELMEGNFFQMFSDEKCLPALFLSYQLCRYRGHLYWLRVFRLEHSGVFYTSSSYFELSSEIVIFHRIFPAHCLWMDSDAFMCSVILSTYNMLLFT